MFLSTVVRHLKLAWHIKVLGFFSAIEYRVSFISKLIGILANNAFWYALWYFFYTRFEEINGWTMTDNFYLMSMGFFSFGLGMFFFGRIKDLAKEVQEGNFDHYLTYPVSPLWYFSIEKFDVVAIGEILTGLIVLFFMPNFSLEVFGLFLLASLISAWIFLNIVLITQSLAFYVGSVERSVDQYFWVLLGFINYPPMIFSGWLKGLLVTIMPVFFIYFLPVELIRNFNWKDVGIIFIYAIVSSIVAYFVYTKGLKRYESGNLISLKS